MRTPTITPHHRADIQGLRGLAVLLVVVYHTGFALPGGFIGVDVFFVISGFVIATMVQREISSSGSFSIRGFFIRRARRLIPALVAMTLVTSALSLLVLSPYGDIQQSMKTAIASQVFLGNMHLFAMNSYDALIYSPFRHLWSLGVEEQFYVAVPFVVALLLRARGSHRRWLMTVCLVACITGSFAAGLGLLSGHEMGLTTLFRQAGIADTAASVGFTSGGDWPARFGFFGAPGRLWEIALGVGAAALAVWWPARRRVGTTLRVGALTAIVLWATLVEMSPRFPGWHALVPVLSTAVLLHGGGVDDDATSRLLTHRLLVWLGDRSYSWYLWHWPFIVFARFLVPDQPGGLLVAAVLSVVPAHLSFVFLEHSWRREASTTRLMLLPVGVAVTAIACMGFWRIADTGLGLPEMGNKSNLASDLGCSNAEAESHSIDACTIGDPARSVRFVLFGDSTARSISGGVWDAVDAVGGTLGISVDGGCKFRATPVLDDLTCNRANERRWSYLETQTVDAVIVNNRQDREGCEFATWSLDQLLGGSPASSELGENSLAYLEDLTLVLSRLEAIGTPMILIEQFPWCGPAKPTVLRPQPRSLNEDGALDGARSMFFRRQREMIEGVSANRVVSTFDALCSSGTCPYFRDGEPLFVDPAHLTDAGSRLLVPSLVAVLRDVVDQ